MPKHAEELYGKAGAYLGHFRKPKNLMRGHNTVEEDPARCAAVTADCEREGRRTYPDDLKARANFVAQCKRGAGC